jgi:hypothetical protein
MDDAAALKRLKLLLKEDGALKIINHFHACTDELVTDQQVAAAGPGSPLVNACKAYAAEHGHTPGLAGGYQSVGHYRLHDVKRIEESPREGWYTAYADDDLGTQCSGQPAALLARLTEHERAG